MNEQMLHVKNEKRMLYILLIRQHLAEKNCDMASA